MTPLFTTSTITDGNMSLRFGAEADVQKNRATFLENNGATYDTHICMRCNHGMDIVAVSHDTPVDTYRMVDAEVLVTQDPSLTLMLLTADCLPTVLFDRATHTIALAHFSRETIAAGLPRATVKYLQEQFGSKPEALVVQSGPHIFAASYRFTKPQPPLTGHMATFREEDDTYVYVDIAGALSAQLSAAGVQTEHVSFSEENTADGNYYSHYQSTREGAPDGRIATITSLPV